jgi:hypothetical protein
MAVPIYQIQHGDLLWRKLCWMVAISADFAVTAT